MSEQLTWGVPREDIDIRVLLYALWKRRLAIFLTTTLCVLAGTGYALLAREWFQAEVVLVPVETRSLANGFGQLGGLASLAGIDIGSDRTNQTPLAVLRSKDFAREFIQDSHLLETLLVESGHYDISSLGGASTKDRQYDMRDAVRVFDETVRRVVEDKKTGLVVVSISWTDPVLAANWANAMTSKLNQKLRSQALAEAERNIKYLQAQMAITSITTLQQSIGKVLESEMQKSLLARGGEEYAFKVIDRATPPKYRSRPKRTRIVMASAFFGMFLSAAFIFGRLWFGLDRSSRASIA